GKDLLGVLAQRRRPADLGRVPAEEFVGQRQCLEFADAGIVEAADQAPRACGSPRISATSFTGPIGTSTASSFSISSSRFSFSIFPVMAFMTSSRRSTRTALSEKFSGK